MPYIPRRMREWVEDIMGVRQTPPDPEAAYRPYLAAQEEEDRRVQAAYAQRLSPFAGRLLLVTDFGSDFAPDYQAAHATRLAEAIQSEVFPTETPLSLSVHLTRHQSEEGRDRQRESATLLAGALLDIGFETILPTQTYEDTEYFWLRTITTAAEDTVHAYGTEPKQVGHIAVVSALHAPQAGIRPANTDGEAFLLTATTGAPEFSWQPISRPDPLSGS